MGSGRVRYTRGVLGYFITMRTYGTWLHGDPDGSVDRDHNRLGEERLGPNEARSRWEREQLVHPPVSFGAEARWVIDATVREVCAHRGWGLAALHVRTTHVHVVVVAPADSPERVMNDFKAYCTRRLREAGVFARDIRVWSHHGSTRYLDTRESFDRAVVYTRDEQGPALDMQRPAGWGR